VIPAAHEADPDPDDLNTLKNELQSETHKGKCFLSERFR